MFAVDNRQLWSFKMGLIRAVLYMLAQSCGAVLGACILWTFTFNEVATFTFFLLFSQLLTFTFLFTFPLIFQEVLTLLWRVLLTWSEGLSSPQSVFVANYTECNDKQDIEISSCTELLLMYNAGKMALLVPKGIQRYPDSGDTVKV